MNASSKKEEILGNLLVIVLDTNPLQNIIVQEPHNFTRILDSVIAFGNAHLMQSTQNKLAILSCHHHATQYLHPVHNNEITTRTQIDGQYENFYLVERIVKERMDAILRAAPQANVNADSLIAGAMSMALCYIAKFQRDTPLGEKLESRMLVVSGSNESASQYMAYMNTFFGAQKLNITIDACAFTKDLALLQQGCDITGGQYVKLQQLDGLLQYLLWVFLPEKSARTKLVLPTKSSVDYRAACFCHRELVDIGYACSVCLSIFCKFTPLCTTCLTFFKLPDKVKSKKKRQPILQTQS